MSRRWDRSIEVFGPVGRSPRVKAASRSSLVFKWIADIRMAQICRLRLAPASGISAIWRRGRVAEGGGLLNRYRVVKPYRGFESLRLRQSPILRCDAPLYPNATDVAINGRFPRP